MTDDELLAEVKRRDGLWDRLCAEAKDVRLHDVPTTELIAEMCRRSSTLVMRRVSLSEDADRAGCTVIYGPAEWCHGSALHLVEECHEAVLEQQYGSDDDED